MAKKVSRVGRARRSAELPAQPNQSLIGGLDVLGQLVAAERGLGSRELARELGMEPTRVNRLLGTLAHLGLAGRTAGRKYVPGPGVHVLAAMSLRGSRLLSAAVPHLARLGAELPGFAVALGVLWRRQVAYLYFAGPGEDPRVAIASRDLYPAEKSSIGQVLLAAMPEREVRALYADRPPAEREALLAELAAARERGGALVDGRTLGVALGDPPFAGLALAGDMGSADRGQLELRLREAAGAIAAEVS